MLKSRVNKGFTLIEVMVALAVFAVAASMLMLVDGNSIRQTRYMQEKVLAAQVADNALNRIQAEKQWPDKGVQGRAETYGGLDWYIRQVVRETREKKFREIIVDVFIGVGKPDDDEVATFSINTYLRMPPKWKKG